MYVHDLHTSILYNSCYLQVQDIASLIAKNQITEGGPVILVQVSNLLLDAYHIERARCRLKTSITTAVSSSLKDILEHDVDFLVAGQNEYILELQRAFRDAGIVCYQLSFLIKPLSYSHWVFYSFRWSQHLSTMLGYFKTWFMKPTSIPSTPILWVTFSSHSLSSTSQPEVRLVLQLAPLLTSGAISQQHGDLITKL